MVAGDRREASYLFAPRRGDADVYWEDISNMAQSLYAAENPADGAEFTYYLGRAAQSAKLIVRGPDGKVIREIPAPTSSGMLHRVTWDLRHVPPPASAGGGGFGGGEEGGGGVAAPLKAAAAAVVVAVVDAAAPVRLGSTRQFNCRFPRTTSAIAVRTSRRVRSRSPSTLTATRRRVHSRCVAIRASP